MAFGWVGHWGPCVPGDCSEKGVKMVQERLVSTDVKVYVGSYILNLVDLTECLQKGQG